MASLIDLFYAGTLSQPEPIGSGSEAKAVACVQGSMRRDFGAFISWAAKQYEELQSASRHDLLVKLLAIQDRVDDAYRKGRWPDFQAALVDAQALLSAGGKGGDCITSEPGGVE